MMNWYGLSFLTGTSNYKRKLTVCMFIITGTFRMQRVQEIATPNMSVSSCVYKMRNKNLTRFCPRNLTSVNRVRIKQVKITLQHDYLKAGIRSVWLDHDFTENKRICCFRSVWLNLYFLQKRSTHRPRIARWRGGRSLTAWRSCGSTCGRSSTRRRTGWGRPGAGRATACSRTSNRC